MKELIKDQVLAWIKEQKREVTTIEVAKALHSTPSAIGKILWTLEVENKVKVRKTGKRNYYSIAEPTKK